MNSRSKKVIAAKEEIKNLNEKCEQIKKKNSLKAEYDDEINDNIFNMECIYIYIYIYIYSLITTINKQFKCVEYKML